MPAQQGTLNLVGESVFEVVALPVSAFVGVDDDGDGRLSDAEVSAHEEQLTQEIIPRGRGTPLPSNGVKAATPARASPRHTI